MAESKIPFISMANVCRLLGVGRGKLMAMQRVGLLGGIELQKKGVGKGASCGFLPQDVRRLQTELPKWLAEYDARVYTVRAATGPRNLKRRPGLANSALLEDVTGTILAEVRALRSRVEQLASDVEVVRAELDLGDGFGPNGRAGEPMEVSR